MDPFELPEDLKGLDKDALADLEKAALDAFDALNKIDPADLSEEQVAEMERLAQAVTAIRDEGAARVEAAEQRQARARAAAEAVTPPEAEGEEGEEPAEDEGEEPEPEAEVETPEAIAASARKRNPSLVRSMPKKAPKRPGKSGSGLTIVAGADIKGVTAASNLDDLVGTAKAYIARSDGFPQYRQGGDAPRPGQPGGPQEGLYLKHHVATIHRGEDAFAGLTERNPDFHGSLEALANEAGRLTRIGASDAKALVAAGGWCAPSETLYDLCQTETLDGILDLPTINVSRGGVNYSQGPDFSSIYGNVGFCQTEAEAEAGTTKDCYEVPCPSFDEVRLDACGICITVPLLTRSAYPELVSRFLEGSMVAHQHKINAKMIAAMSAAIGAKQTVTGLGTSFGDTLTALENAAMSVRYVHRLGENAVLEVVAPAWLKASIRADIRNRTGQMGPVSDAQIDDHFAAANLRVQWVFGYQDIVTECEVDLPTTVDVMIYPAGAFVKGTNDVISLDTVYDTTSLQSNVYTGAFYEEGVLLLPRCPGACELTIPLCSAGRTGTADLACA